MTGFDAVMRERSMEQVGAEVRSFLGAFDE